LSGAPLPDGSKGRIALFSRWHERRMDHIREAPGGFSQSAGHEGDFIGVRQHVPLRRGIYRIEFRDVGRDPQGRGRLIAQLVREQATGAEWHTGALCFPGEVLRLRPRIAAFVEMFGAPIRPRDIPVLRIRFGDLAINGAAVPLRQALVRYRVRNPPFAQARGAGAGAVAVETGRRFRRFHLPVEQGAYTERIG